MLEGLGYIAVGIGGITLAIIGMRKADYEFREYVHERCDELKREVKKAFDDYNTEVKESFDRLRSDLNNAGSHLIDARDTIRDTMQGIEGKLQ